MTLNQVANIVRLCVGSKKVCTFKFYPTHNLYVYVGAREFVFNTDEPLNDETYSMFVSEVK